MTHMLMNPQTLEASCCNRILGSIARRVGLRRKSFRISSAALLLACSWVGSPGVLYAANYYVNGACALNGNGTSAGCASAAGGTGAWNGFSGISAGAGGDVIHIRGGTYSNEQDYYNFPAGVNGVAGNPLIVQNYAGEDVILEGSADIRKSIWTAAGGGVYKCTGGQCTTSRGTLFPMAAWYKRAGQATEEVLYLQMSGNCDSTLPAGFMRYGTNGPVCVHLSDGSSPAAAQYFRINMYNTGMLLNNYRSHDITFRRNPGGGSFKIQRFVQYGITVQSGKNTNITVDGLDIGYVMDRCINADYYASNDGTNIMANNNYHFLNNELHHCGQEGIHDSDDSGPDGRIQGNEIHHIQAPPWFERCDPISGGKGCNVSGFSDQCSSIRLTSGKNYTVSGNYFHDNCGGMNGRGYDYNLEEWFYDVIIENNVSWNMAAGHSTNGRATIAMMMESVRAGPFQNVTIRNNRFFQNDHCFSINIGLSGPQVINYLNNTCVDFRQEATVPGGDAGNASGTVNFINNIFAAINTSPSLVLLASSNTNTGFQAPLNNNIYCPTCSVLVNWNNVTYTSGNLNGFGKGNVYGNPGLALTGLPPALKLLSGSGAAYQHGMVLTPNFPDFEGQPRPATGAWDIGADEFSGTGSRLPAPTNLRLK
jgi:hypothetical protein